MSIKMSKPMEMKFYDQDKSSEKDWSSDEMDFSSDLYDEEEDDEDEEDKLPDDIYNPTSWDRLPDETEEEYEDRIQDQNDFLEHLS